MWKRELNLAVSAWGRLLAGFSPEWPNPPSGYRILTSYLVQEKRRALSVSQRVAHGPGRGQGLTVWRVDASEGSGALSQLVLLPERDASSLSSPVLGRRRFRSQALPIIPQSLAAVAFGFDLPLSSRRVSAVETRNAPQRVIDG